MKIYGAGLAGLLAAHAFPNAQVVERTSPIRINHRAVLRFRTPRVGDFVGIEFRPVHVHKGIFMQDRFAEPTIQLANLYSRKVIGRFADRSIWNLAPCERFIAPEDFTQRLINRVGHRIIFEHEVSADEFMLKDEEKITTMPMSVAAGFVYGAREEATPTFEFAPITVRRFRVDRADVFQTIYFPDPRLSLYRASITGDLLIVEYVGEPAVFKVQYDGATRTTVADTSQPSLDELDFTVQQAFGLAPCDVELITPSHRQSFGKIAPIDDTWRKNFIFTLTHRLSIFSLGRFATWRNILLDDVLDDLAAVRKLAAATSYDRLRASVGK